MLRLLGVGAVAGASLPLVGCVARSTSNAASSPSRIRWATGGTKALVGSFPDPFTADDEKPSARALTCALTLGPCHAASVERRDISEGQAGLPTRLLFRVVDVDGKALAGAEVDVWHASPRGLYSGDDAADMCTGNDAGARKARYFRGKQRTDATGRACFETCLPGWYHGRAVHVHFTIRVNGQAYVTAQLGFDDALLDDVLGHEPGYVEQGVRDTRNTEDGILGGSLGTALFATKRTDEGALLAYKTVVLRRALGETICGDSGDSGGPPGPPGPPRRGGPPGGPGAPPPPRR